MATLRRKYSKLLYIGFSAFVCVLPLSLQGKDRVNFLHENALQL